MHVGHVLWVLSALLILRVQHHRQERQPGRQRGIGVAVGKVIGQGQKDGAWRGVRVGHQGGWGTGVARCRIGTRGVQQALDVALGQPFRCQQMNEFAAAIKLRIEHRKGRATRVTPQAGSQDSVAG
ncbi:hypothetical protein D3C71_1540590 [compost metagenome]